MLESKITGRKKFVGVVISDKSDKTVTVKVVRRKLDALLKKNFLRSKNYAAHDELNQYKVGDQVVIEESRPFSKTKKWQVLEKSNKN